MMVAMPHWVPAILPNLPLFALAALILAMVPGPSTAVVLRQTLRSGRRSAFTATLANELGLFFWALVAAFGIAGLVAASQVAYDVIRLGGAGALILLGLRSLVHARAEALSIAGGGSSAAGWSGFRAGLVTILANPKAAVFAASFLPQFVPRGAPLLSAMVALGLFQVLIDTAWYVLLAWAVSQARRLLTRPRVRQRLEQVSGLVLIAVGVRLVVERA
jgi:threonine/homoserine/homoserine lactone efflux protein